MSECQEPAQPETAQPGPIPVLLITGPTAAGKTAAAIDVARAVGGEIISADSMAVYRSMDIGTAKPSSAEQAMARFHLIDIVEPEEPYSLHRWLEDCRRAVEDIWSRGGLPIICGGTALYAEAFMDGFVLPPTEPGAVQRLRRRLEEKLQQEGIEALVRELASLDPAAPAQVDIHNPRRVIRAIEIIRLTGRPLAEARGKSEQLRRRYLLSAWLLSCPRRVLFRRIDMRVDQMLAAGWLDEVRALLSRLRPGCTALQAIGYRHLVQYLQRGGSLEDVVEAIKRDTRRFAKRQLTWWRRRSDVHWLLWESGPDFHAARLTLIRAARDLLDATHGHVRDANSGEP